MLEWWLETKFTLDHCLQVLRASTRPHRPRSRPCTLFPLVLRQEVIFFHSWISLLVAPPQFLNYVRHDIPSQNKPCTTEFLLHFARCEGNSFSLQSRKSSSPSMACHSAVSTYLGYVMESRSRRVSTCRRCYPLVYVWHIHLLNNLRKFMKIIFPRTQFLWWMEHVSPKDT